MKNPRDLLLERHAEIQAKLDTVRRQALQTVFNTKSHQAETQGISVSSLDWAVRLWREIFWRSRVAWLGMAAAWGVILALNLSAEKEAHTFTNPLPPKRTRMVLVLPNPQAWLSAIEDSEQPKPKQSTPEKRMDKPHSELSVPVLTGENPLRS